MNISENNKEMAMNNKCIILSTCLLILGIGLGVIIGCSASNRYEIKASGGSRSYVYKLDKRTGQMYLVLPTGEREIRASEVK